MHKFIKKLSPLTLGISMISCPLFAEADLDMRLSKIESQMRECGTSNPRGTYGAKLADASPNIDGYGFYLTADAVYYKLFEDNNQYAFSTVILPTATDNTVKSYSTNFDWSWGFKTGLGYYAEHDYWQSGFEFTYLQTQASNNALVDTSRHLYQANATLEHDDPSTTTYKYAHQAFKTTFYNLDWTFGKDFFISKYLSLKPELGVKSTWFYQQRHQTWSQKSTTPQDVDKHVQDNYCGVGPKADIEAKFYLGKNFSIVGGVDVALLFATNNVSYSQVTSASPTDLYASNHQHKQHISPYLGVDLGIAYDTNFKDDSFNLGIKLAYEQQYYNKASRTLNQEAPTASDVSVQGIDVHFVFSF